jgi:leucyl-tRNA synthetase
MYIGGVEHAVLHLLYSRFWTKFLHDIGVVDFDEPFIKLFNQGMITGKNGIKMSKSKGNVISPDDLVENYGCDSLRMYELFVGPPELDAEWDDRGIDGVYRFLSRFYNMVMENKNQTEFVPSREMVRVHHKMIDTISRRFESFSLNTVVSGFMEYTNALVKLNQAEGGIDHATLEDAVIMLAPFAPHIGEELWRELGHEDSVFHQSWPVCDPEAMKEDEIEYPVQMMGKTRAVIKLPVDVTKDEALAKAKEALGEKLEGKTILKEIFVPKKIINIVAK